MSFRKKIFLSYIVVFFVLSIFLYPIISHILILVQENNLRVQTRVLAQKLQGINPEEKIKHLGRKLEFEMSLWNHNGDLLFSTIPTPSPFVLEEVQKTLLEGGHVSRHYSPTFKEDFLIFTLPFVSQEGGKYVLLTLFPYNTISDLSQDLTLTIFSLTLAILLLFSTLAWFIIHYLTRPVTQILQAIKPFQLGKEEHIPEIKLGKRVGSDEFAQLADTLNALTRKIEGQIRSLTEAKNEKSAILESLGEGVVAVDEKFDIIYMNKMAEVLLGIQAADFVGKKFSLVGRPECDELLKHAQNSKEPVQTVIKPDRKQKRYLDVVAITRGKKQGAILVLQDKTGLHKVIELGKDFIANASHELKTPITIIRGFAETLHEHPELSPDINSEITKKIVTNCQRMDTLVKNLLTLAAIDEGLPRSRMQEVDIYDLIEQCKQTILSVHPTADIKIETKGEEVLHLMLDHDLFYQAILNLLDNAVKYSSAPAKVLVILEKKGHNLSIQVVDHGIGIPTEDLDRIFERFYAVDKSHSRSLGGSGLGLSIVERIVDKHRGKIEVESKLGKGTTFTITLPIEEDDDY